MKNNTSYFIILLQQHQNLQQKRHFFEIFYILTLKRKRMALIFNSTLTFSQKGAILST